MTDNSQAPNTPVSEKPLESWKEIAAYLKRGARTVRRWEREERLPVHRHVHQARSTVYAYPSELDAWKEAREPRLREEELRFALSWRRPAPLLALASLLLLALVSSASGPLSSSAAAMDEAAGMVARQVWSGPRVDILGAPSPDGRYLSFVDWETGDLAIRDLTTGENRRLTNKGSWFQSVEFALFSTVSPDAQQIAYSWFNKDFSFDLRIIGLDGSAPRILFSAKEEVEYLQPHEWSPDGKHILTLFSRKDRTNQIVLVSVAGGSVQVVKTLDWRYPHKLSFSPDGRYIAYDFPPKEDAPERDLFLLATDGSRETRLVEHLANDLLPIWVPEGNRVLFASDRTGTMGLWTIEVADGKSRGAPELIKRDIGRSLPMGFARNAYYYGLQTGMNDVYVAELDLATGTVLSPPAPASPRFVGSNRGPAWSPDGKYLAYISVRGPVPGELGEQVLSIRSLETGQERELSPQLNSFQRPRWSPDGRSILVTGNDKKNRQGLYRIDAQTGEVAPIVQSEPGVYLQQPAWSPDAQALFYQRNDRTQKLSRILMRNLETGQEKELYRAVIPFAVRSLALSPDGRLVAFIVIDQTTRSSALMLMPSTGGETRELFRLKEPESFQYDSIAWTSDARQILFVRATVPERRSELWRIPAQGGEPQKLGLAMDDLRALRIHPDGRRIAFSAGQNKAEVWMLENFLPALKAAQKNDE